MSRTSDLIGRNPFPIRVQRMQEESAADHSNTPRSATKYFYREGKKVAHYSFIDFLHGYVYLRWPYFYISIITGEHIAIKWLKPLVNLIGRLIESQAKPEGDESVKQNKPNITFADTYHGKVVPPKLAEQLVTMDQEIELRNLEQVIPYATAKDIVMQNPRHIAVLDCPCRAARKNPCFPLDVCMVIGDPFASMVVQHHPQRSRWISQEEAVTILEAEHERGHVHHAFFKDAMLGRFYAICNCCSCCCGAMQAHFNGLPFLASSGYVIRHTEDECSQCALCVDACPFAAISLDGQSIRIDSKLCMGCGICVSHCHRGSLIMIRDDKKCEPLDMHMLLSNVS